MALIKRSTHAKLLLQMLEGGKDPCKNSICPHIGFLQGGLYVRDCKLCVEFIGSVYEPFKSACPCFEFGAAGAAKRTWIALEEGGYLD